MDTIVTPVTVITLDSTRIVHSIKADLVARYFPPVVRLVQYDQSLPVIAVSMMQNGQTYTLPSGAAANIRVHKPDATYVYNPALGCDSTRNIVYFEVTQAMAAANGDGLAIVEIVVDGDIAGTSLITLHFEENPVPEDAIESSDEWETIYELGERIIASTVTPVSTAAGMTDHDVVYLYTGLESGWNQGHMYYYNGTRWVDAGIASTDKTLSVYGLAADAKATGDAIADVRNDLNEAIEEFAVPTQEAVDNWLNDHPEATTTVQDGSITLPKFSDSMKNSLYADGVKKIWSIQTNINDGVFYGISASVDGLGHMLVDGYTDFLHVDNRNLGSDWQHYQHGDYHCFTITHKTATADFYFAITKDFVNWTHRPINIGYASASGFADPYVWTPQIFDFNGKTYINATVQEGLPSGNGSRYDTGTRFSGIYVAEITIDYANATITKNSDFTKITFSTITDKSGATHDISGNSMDAWFVENGGKIYCVFNDRYMLEIHSAVANDLSDTFEILEQNIFKMQNIEAPSVFQINDNLWQISACYYGGGVIAQEENIRCITSDFEHFYEFAFMRRIDTSTSGTLYENRMRNPSFFYMTDEQEHNFCAAHSVKTIGYNHIFKPAQINMGYPIYNILRYTDVAIPPNTEFIVDSTGIQFPELNLSNIYGGDNCLVIINTTDARRTITYAGKAYQLLKGECIRIDFKGKYVSIVGTSEKKTGADVMTPNSSGYSVTGVSAKRTDGIVSLDCVIGDVSLSQGANTIGTLSLEYRPYTSVFTSGALGTGSAYGVPVRIAIEGSNVIAYAGSAQSASTLRFSARFSNY